MMPRTFILTEPWQLPRFQAFLSKQELPLDVSVKPYIAPRTIPQNSRLHLLFAKVAAETGNTLAAVKQGYKEKFLAAREENFNGKTILIWPETHKMNKKELREFMDQVEGDAIQEFAVLLND